MRIDWLPSVLRRLPVARSFWSAVPVRRNARPAHRIGRSLESLEDRALLAATNLISINLPPIGVIDTYSLLPDTTLNAAVSVLGNDTDPNGDVLNAQLVTGPINGTVNLNPDGLFTYTPNPGFIGTDVFTYLSNDGLLGSLVPTVVSLIVSPTGNSAPVANNDTFHVTQDSLLNLSLGTQLDGVLANDTDADGNLLLAQLVTQPQHGTITFLPTGTFIYTPNAGYVGPDSFTYQASDLTALSNIATASIVVDPVNVGPIGNQAPVAVNDSFAATEDSLLNISLGGVLANDTDADGNLLLASLVTPPQHGTLVLLPTGMFTYTPDANYSGSDTFSYQASDGLALSNVATVTITVSPLNDAPVALNDSYSTATSTALNVAASGVLSNDFDIDSASLTAILVAGPSHGSVTLNSDGSFTYTPTAGYTGTDAFTYRANDGTANSNIATATITIAGVANTAPVAQNDTYNINEDVILTTTLANGVLFNDSDTESDPLSASLISNPSHGTVLLNANGTFTYTPNANYSGTDTFTYQASDGTSNSNVATVTITIAATNDAPIGVNDAYNTDEGTPLIVGGTGVLSNDTDPDGDSLTAILVTGPTHGTLSLNSNGSFTYTPTALFNGTDTFTYQAYDGTTNSAPITVTLTVNSVNSAPVALDDIYATNEDSTLTITAPGVLANDSDTDGDTLTANLVTFPLHGTLTLNTNGAFTYVPDANYNGTDSFTYRVNDGTTNGNIATVQLTINAVNDAPVGSNDTYNTATGVPLIVPASGVLTNDTDVDGDSLTSTLVTNPAHGTLTLNSDGSYTYTPTGGFQGTDSFTYQINDGTTSSSPVTVTIQVNATNSAPVSVNDSYTVTEDTPLTVIALGGVLANDTDADSDPLTASIVTLPQHGTVSLNADGSFIYTPDADYTGSDSFTYRANDGTVNGNTATVNLTVTAVGEPPVVTTSAGNRTVKGHKKLVLDPGVTITDADSDNFGGGSIRIAIQTGAGTRDTIGFLRGGANRGRVNVRRGELRVGKVVVGTITGGIGGAPVNIELNSNATIERVRTILQNVIFRGTNRQGGPRVVTIQVTDNTGLQSNIATKTVDVT